VHLGWGFVIWIILLLFKGNVVQLTNSCCALGQLDVADFDGRDIAGTSGHNFDSFLTKLCTIL
jgi:hypothetical protein